MANTPVISVSEEGQLFQDTEDYIQFRKMMFKKSGIDLNLYKQQQMHRRLLTLVEKAGCENFVEYFNFLDKNSTEYGCFLDRMTINVSELFRNPEKWIEMEKQVLPPMLAGRKPLRIWSAGCSYGAEPFTLAILLDRISPGVSHTIHATDLDLSILAKAKQGIFDSNDIRNLPAADIEKYFQVVPSTKGPGLPQRYQIIDKLRSRVTFRQQNLLADRFEEGYDLICCRNVVIYFTNEAKDALYVKFMNALRPGGVLFVGGTERIFGYQALGFESAIPFFYSRADEGKKAAA